jgi:hypothetical protein
MSVLTPAPHVRPAARTTAPQRPRVHEPVTPIAPAAPVDPRERHDQRDRHGLDDRGRSEAAQAGLRRFEQLLATLPLTPVVVVDLPGRRLLVDGRTVELTRQEFDLVAYLARSAGRVVGRDELYAAAWRTQDLSAGTRTVDVHVRRVRAKSGLEGLITTVRGVGYRLNPVDGLLVQP